MNHLSVSDAAPHELAAELLRRILPESQHKAMQGESMAKTPERMVKALAELLDGYDIDLGDIMTTFPSENEGMRNPMIVVRDVEFASMCEHHVLPFNGTVDVVYVPSDRIVGLSKIPRIVRAFSRRLQVQERLTSQVADALAPLRPAGVMVVCKGRHTCCSMRGAESNTLMITSAMRGVFETDAMARAEAMSLLGQKG